ncbi:MAG TPA: histidine ammonia-lyase [Candidatus Polarisedimenticolia bacterium]|nr:histidine ammonia-lyase [Candidatus Polarisedimenticolia bacterium]
MSNPLRGVVRIDGNSLSLEEVDRVAGRKARAVLSSSARRRMERGRRIIENLARGEDLVYGVNTGFGGLKGVRVPVDRLEILQANLIRSHCAGVGELLTAEQTRALMLLRANVLARGNSGVRPEVVDLLLAMLDRDLLPPIPSQGSVGASGDLAPLAHLVLAMIGEGRLRYAGRLLPAAPALRRARLRPLRLRAKEGLSLINGTQLMTALGTLALIRAENLLLHADLAGALSLEALQGSRRAFDRRIEKLRPHPGQAASAANLRTLLAHSEIEKSHARCGRVQDSYALRCMPQVHGAARDALVHVRGVLEREVNAVTDNPILFPAEGILISAGNFHGEPVAMVLDYLAIAVAEVASISERRIERLTNPDLSGLPAFLSPDPGLHSGFMMAQVTAAALVSENKGLAHPASVDSIPTSASQEDHVSMGAWAARKAVQVLENAERVVAIELMAGCQGLDFLAPLATSRPLEAARRAVRRVIPRLESDRVLSEDIVRMTALLRAGDIRGAVERETGPLR